MSLATGVLAGLGATFRRRAGDLLTALVEGLTSEGERAHDLVQPTGPYGSATAFDATTTPDPHWLGAATGTHIPAGLTVDQERAYLHERPAWRRGTVPAMKAAGRTVLVGLTERVDVLERRDGNPYLFGVRVWLSELPGGDTAPLIAAVLEEKPLGLLEDVTVEVIPYDATFEHMTAEHGTFAQIARRFPTFEQMTTHVPEEGTIF